MVMPLESPAEFTVQACAKYGKARTVSVPQDSVASVDTCVLLERPLQLPSCLERLLGGEYAGQGGG
ncbi:hypothetical protein AB0I68_33170 [Streptomyces sp. NPDC050448]|uniref:hypothetical protein n=1 Tax=Streptomyces sp. NPDC050448 TaxID=3155404 RepID=UPI003448E76D